MPLHEVINDMGPSHQQRQCSVVFPHVRDTGLQGHGHHQMVNIEIRMIIFFAAKDCKVL